SGLDGSSPYSVTPEKIVLSRLVVHAFGGTVQGDVQIANWSGTIPGNKPLPQRGTIRLHLNGVQIRKIAASVATAKMPLDKVELAGSVSGDINSTWTGSLERA